MKNKFHVVKNYFATPKELGDILLYQVGRRFCAEGMVIPTHSHMDWVEISSIVDGEGVISTNGVDTRVRSGDIYISFPCDFHRIESDTANPLKYDFIAFSTSDPLLAREIEEMINANASGDKRTLRDEKISYLLGNIVAEISDPSELSDELLLSMIHQLIIYVVRACRSGSRQASFYGGITDSEALCLQLMNYIDTHIYTINCLSWLSEITGYSYNYMSNVFKKNTSCTLLDYYHSKRMKTAMLLLAEDKRTVSEIADLLGYSSIYTFSRAFKKHYGVAPREYRVAQRGAKE